MLLILSTRYWPDESRHVVISVICAVVLMMSKASPAQSQITQEVLDAPEVRYTLALPQEFTNSHSNALVISLHYGGPVSPWYGRALLENVVEPALRPLGAVMVAPDCSQRAWLDCEDALQRVVTHVQHKYATNSSCVFLTGYSKGGIGTWALAAKQPSRYTAAIVMAARAPDDAILAQWRLPVRVIHGANDQLFPVQAASDSVARLRSLGVDGEIEVLEDATHYDTHRFTEALSKQLGWLQQICQRNTH
jgi:predicted peptidase